jgi:hypothetical protein
MISALQAMLGVAIAVSACAPEPPPAAPSPVAAMSPSGEPTPTTPVVRVVPSSPTEAVVQQRASLDACYALARASNPNLGRTSIEIAFAIDMQGKPITVDLQYRNRIDDKAKECMRDAALALRFPPSMQGRQAATLSFAPPVN